MYLLCCCSIRSHKYIGAVRSIRTLKVKINILYTFLCSIFNKCRSTITSVIWSRRGGLLESGQPGFEFSVTSKYCSSGGCIVLSCSNQDEMRAWISWTVASWDNKCRILPMFLRWKCVDLQTEPIYSSKLRNLYNIIPRFPTFEDCWIMLSLTDNPLKSCGDRTTIHFVLGLLIYNILLIIHTLITEMQMV